MTPGSLADARWQVEQVAAVAPKPSAFSAAQPLAVPSRWTALGCDERGVWGRCAGGGAEPYEVAADHVTVRFQCTCPSRQAPCKHALALLLMWARGVVPGGPAPHGVGQWIDRASPSIAGQGGAADHADDAADAAGVGGGPAGASGAQDERTAVASPVASPADGPGGDLPGQAPQPPTPPDGGRDDRVARMRAGLVELRRWIEDRLRAGLADPGLARYETWDRLAARLVDAQVGGLANRVRRIAGLAGDGPNWHAALLAELGTLSLLIEAGLRLPTLPGDLADSVAVALGWQVRQASVLAGVPDTDRWLVAGRSDTREDRIEVRRVWLRGQQQRSWAMILSFAAYGQALDTSLPVGSSFVADLYRYPGCVRLRALIGSAPAELSSAGPPHADTVSGGLAQAGRMIAAEPWLDRVPMCVTASLAGRHGAWLIADATGALPLAAGEAGVAVLGACTAGAPAPVTGEWTPQGFIPLTVHLADRTVDIGRLADDSFVSTR